MAQNPTSKDGRIVLTWTDETHDMDLHMLDTQNCHLNYKENNRFCDGNSLDKDSQVKSVLKKKNVLV